MQTSGLVPDTFISGSELSELAVAAGPQASVYLTTEADVHDAADRLQRRWKTLRSSLTEQGADDAVLETIDSVVPDAYLQGQGLAVFAGSSGLHHVEHHSDLPADDVGVWGPLPSLLPLIEWRQSSLPHVVVLTDRRGADLVAVRREGPDLEREAGGEDFPLRKSGPGGWSQRRFQQRAENTWGQNAGDVAVELAGLVDRVGARLVVVSGDVRAIQLLGEALPPALEDLVQVIDGGRSEDGSEESVAAEVDRLVAVATAKETTEAVEKFTEELGQHDRAVEGVGPTVTALGQAQVAGLLIDSGALADRQGWFGPEAAHVATDPGELDAMGFEAPEQALLADVLVRSALASGAGVRVVPSEMAPKHGVGALLRWAS